MILIDVQEVGVGAGPAPDLPPVTADNTDGGPALVAVGTEDGPVLASLVIGGRYRPDTGGVFLDGRDDTDALRAAVALVDTPGVAEPAPSLPLGSVVREELVFAGLPAGRAAVRQFLHQFGLHAYVSAVVGNVPPTERIRVLAELAILRPGIRALVITSPERHGGSTAGWLDVALEMTRRDIAVFVIAGHAAIDDALAHLDPSVSVAPLGSR
ncbi:hypothetical protein DVJ78_07390 [Humibacter sp. BT305]|nr:hypothetical protein DVJ78_07390 [Humibacter sp. BT305]